MAPPLSPISRPPVQAPRHAYHEDLYDLIDLDGSRPRWTQYPALAIEIRQPSNNALVYGHVLRRNVDSMMRQNSFAQRSATVDLVLHDVPDLHHLAGRRPVHAMYKLLVHEGYAGQTVQTFAGYITKASFSNHPRELRLVASDCLYLARTFFILTPLRYEGWTAEDAVRDVLTRAGISTNNINIGGYNASTHTYDQSFHAPPLPVEDTKTAKQGAQAGYQSAETYLQHLCDLYGWRFWCDVHGKIEFQYVRPFPQPTPSVVPAVAGTSGYQYALRFMSAPAAQAMYGDDTLPGNLLHVVDHSFSADEMRNFIGVYDGRTAPTYVKAPPGTGLGDETAAPLGFPAPKPYTPTGPVVDASGNPTTRAANTPRLGYWTTAQVAASDQIVSTATVRQHPNTTDTTTTDMAHFVANRILHDLNRESETAEIVTFGNPFIDLGQTVYVEDKESYLKGTFFVTGYQTRISSSGYTTQLKLTGGPTWKGQGARSKPHFRVLKRHDGMHQAHVITKHGHTMTGSTATGYAITPRQGTGLT